MTERLNWENLKLFLSVAHSGGLAGAVRQTGVSAPTLGRRMLALEQALGVRLFERHQYGYELTSAGTELLDSVREMEKGAVAIARWRSTLDSSPTIRIAAGAWTSRFIARHIVDLESSSKIELLTGAGYADLSRREANLGIRNSRPDGLGLAGQKIGKVEFAIYGAPKLVGACMGRVDEERLFSAFPWIVFAPGGPAVPSAVWLMDKLACAPILQCSSPYPLLDAAISGAGLCILPCFIGNEEEGLVQVSKVIPELSHIQWLVSHDDDRHIPSIRDVAKKLRCLFVDHKQLFVGVER